MKKFFYLLFLLLPWNVFAKDNIYELELSNSFVHSSEKNYQNSELSIRNYLIYQSISNLELQDNQIVPVSDEMKYYSLNDQVKIPLLENYDSIQIKIRNTLSISPNLYFSSLDHLLDSSIYSFSLLKESLDTEESTLKYQKGSNDIYATITSKNTNRDLLIIRINKDRLYFDLNDDLTVADNTSFVTQNSNNELEYVSLIFTEKELVSDNIHSSVFTSSLLLCVIGLFVIIFVVSIFYKKKKE